MIRLHNQLERLSTVLQDADIDDWEVVYEASKLLRELYKELDGQPEIKLADSLWYKVIPSSLADKITKEKK